MPHFKEEAGKAPEVLGKPRNESFQPCLSESPWTGDIVSLGDGNGVSAFHVLC